MNNRILIDIVRVKEIVDGPAYKDNACFADVLQSVEMQRALSDLADDINCALPDYECTLVHLDTRDYLAFVRVPDLDQESEHGSPGE